MNWGRRLGISQTCLVASLVFTLLAAGLIGGFWLFHEMRQAAEWKARVRADFLAEQKTLMRERVHRVVATIQWQRQLAEERAAARLNARVNDAWYALAAIHERFTGSEPAPLIRERILESFLHWPIQSGVTHWFVLGPEGRCILWDGYPEMAGRDLRSIPNLDARSTVERLLTAEGAESTVFSGTAPAPPGGEVGPQNAILAARRFPPLDWIVCGALTRSDLEARSRERALRYVADIRYGDHGYVFVNTLDGHSLVFDGQLLPAPVDNRDLTDADGLPLMELEREIARQPDGGFLRYRFPKLGKSEPVPKLSYIIAFPDWNWMIGTGVYLDEIEPVIARKTAEVRRQLRIHIAWILGSVLVLLLFIALLARFISRGIDRSFTAFSRFLQDAARSAPDGIETTIRPEEVYFREFTQLADQANEMIHSRNEALSALRESEERLQLTMEATRDGIWDWGLAADHLYFSPRYFTMAGYAPDAFPHTLDAWRERVHPDDLPAAEKAVADHLEGRTPAFRTEFRFRTADGDWRWFMGRGRAVKWDDEGRPIRLIGTHTDISDQKAAQQALLESERTYRNIFENAQIGLFRSLGEKGVFTVCNDALGRMLGYDSGAECVGDYRLHDGYVDPDARKRMLGVIRHAGRVRNFEARFRRRDGGTVWLRYSARYNPENDGIEGVVADVTEQKRMEEELRTSEETARAMLDATSDTAVLVERDETIVSCNEIFLRKTDRKKDATVGHPLADVLPEPSVARWRRELVRVFETGAPRQFEESREGRRFTNRCYPIFGEDGAVCRAAVFSRDFTEVWEARQEQARLQDRLERSRKMEALGLLAGGVAHDLNNILSGVVSYPELLLMELPEDSSLRRPVEAMHAAGVRAAAVVSDLLTVARGVASPREPVNLNRMIEEYLASPEHGSLVTAHPAVTLLPWLSETPPHVSGSPVHLRKALMNLVANAVEAVEGEGQVLISTEIRRLDAPLAGPDPVPAGSWSLLTVSDDGPGISDDDLAHIFEPFYTRKSMGRSGTGLGLAVVWNTVRDHDGHIRVATGAEGTAFTLFLPAIAPPAADPEPESPLTTWAGKGEEILVVDDEPAQREIACALLEKLGYRAEAVAGGEEAVAFLRERPVDLVLLDMVMDPGINGRETYERILEIRPGQRAVVASGMAETDEFHRVERLGVAGLLKKPYTLKRLGKLLREALEADPTAENSELSP